MLLSLILVGGISSGSAIARSVVVVEMAPPPAQVELVPVQRHGYAWAPGYWRWERGHHVWVKGHSMRARTGYEWSPDRWNQVDNRHEFQPGRWTRSSEGHAQ